MRKGVTPDFIPEGMEGQYPALRDKNGRPSDYFVEDPKPVAVEAKVEAKKGAARDA